MVDKKNQSDPNHEEQDSYLMRRFHFPQTLYLFPVIERPYFPQQTRPLIMPETLWLESIRALKPMTDRVAGVILCDVDSESAFDIEQCATVGTVIRVHNPLRESGKIEIVAEGLARFKIEKWLSKTAPYQVEVSYPDGYDVTRPVEIMHIAAKVLSRLDKLKTLSGTNSEEIRYFFKRFSPKKPVPLADFAASLTNASKQELQAVLEMLEPEKRMHAVLDLIDNELEAIQTKKYIQSEVEKTVSKKEREFFLREQLKAIRAELGMEKDDKAADVELFRSRLDNLHCSEDALAKIESNLHKLEILDTKSSEYSMTRNHLDALTSVPWGQYSEDHYDLTRAKEVLDAEHEGLFNLKKRIIEFIALGAINRNISGIVILLSGPPGVGKTSIGRSIANALGRKFYKFSLAGVRDEATIKGHRRTYVGAMSGKLIHALSETKTMNPVIMLDEIDKVVAGTQGAPIAALLEVLDPEQNHEFLDHYLDVRCDLSKVLFICTANQTEYISQPLLDRMELLPLAGYIFEEKVAIANKHLWRRHLDKIGLTNKQLQLDPAATQLIVEGYAREAGVRRLNQLLGLLVRKAAVQLVEAPNKKITITVDNLKKYLGEPKYEDLSPIHQVGVATGLGWTPLGGTTIDVESRIIHHLERGFQYTGQMGHVMQESAQIAYSYIMSNLKSFGAASDSFDRGCIHLHVPEGATPKDGPSAGITMASALLSLARNEKVKANTAMTGELTLTGQVLAVDGIQEKVTGAKRAGVQHIILPAGVEGDYHALPEHVKAGLTIYFVKAYHEVFDILFNDKN